MKVYFYFKINEIILYYNVRGLDRKTFYSFSLNISKGAGHLMFKRLKEKLKKRWKDFLGQERVPNNL